MVIDFKPTTKIDFQPSDVSEIPEAKPLFSGDTGLRGFATGLAQSEIKLAQHIARIITKPISKITGLPEPTGISEEVLKAKTSAQQFGQFAGETAQFAIPSSKVGLLTKGSGFVRRMAAEGTTAAGIQVAQEGEIGTETRDIGIISALFPVVGKTVKTVKDFIKNPENTARVINSLIKPLAKDFSYGKNPGRAIAEEGITANSFDELANKISIRRKEIGQEIGKVMEKHSEKQLDISDAFSPVDDAIAEAKKFPETNETLISRLKSLKNDLLKIQKNEAGEEIATRKLTGLTPQEALDFKRDIGDITKFTGNPSDDKAVNASLKQTYGKIKEKINTAIPEVIPLNEKYADLTSAEIATKYREKIAERQNIVPFKATVSGLGGALITAITTGGAAVPTVLIGLGVAGTEKALATTYVKTRFAKWLAEATPKDKKALFEKVPWAKGVIFASLIGEE